MKKIIVLIILLISTACAPKTPDPNQQIQAAVAQTVAAIPTSTPYPTPRTFPTPTLANLEGLFCEYQFCVGHPVDMAFFDASAQRNPLAPSTISQGWVATLNANIFIQLMWQNATGAQDAHFMLDLIIDPKADARNGDLIPLTAENVTALYVPITSTATAAMPNGGAAVWTCGGRAFAWKAYTPKPDTAKGLATEALQKFRCDSN